jgi:hypothetical protein
MVLAFLEASNLNPKRWRLQWPFFIVFSLVTATNCLRNKADISPHRVYVEKYLREDAGIEAQPFDQGHHDDTTLLDGGQIFKTSIGNLGVGRTSFVEANSCKYHLLGDW